MSRAYGSGMARLIHLNGPPAVGKTTMAERFVARHPGSLLLDIDRLRTMVGGWRDEFGKVGQIVRPLAQNMMRTHLGGGFDVVVPQYLSDPSEVEQFERVADDEDADFIEVMLIADVDECVRRFADRHAVAQTPLSQAVAAFVDARGGDAQLRLLHQQLLDLLVARPQIVVVLAARDDVDLTYGQVLDAVQHHNVEQRSPDLEH